MELTIQPQIVQSLDGQDGSLRQSWQPGSDTFSVGSLRLTSRFFLAPLAGYTNLGFRLAVRELGGVGLATTDLINARALVRGSGKTNELLRTCAADRPLAVQIYGADPVE